MMKKNYRLECYTKDGYVALFNECEANCLENAIGIFVRELLRIEEYEEDFDTDIKYAILDALTDRFTVWFDRRYKEMGPTDKMYDFTIITVHLDVNI